jgi:hypothetical protein
MKKLILAIVIIVQSVSMMAMNDAVRLSREENVSTPFPYGKEWGDLLFYDKDSAYYEFTNFYPVEITIDGEVWPSSEHYFQAQRFPNNPGIRDFIRTKCRTARQAFEAVRADRNKHALMSQAQWNRIKWDVMYRAVKAKFEQSQELKDLLLGTGDRVLVEDSPVDTYWGIGENPETGRNGYNNLGIILMKVRDELR